MAARRPIAPRWRKNPTTPKPGTAYLLSCAAVGNVAPCVISITSGLAAVIAKGLATGSSVEAQASEAVHEFYFRRIGLGVAPLIITLLAVSLYLYIRRIERRQAALRCDSLQPRRR